MISQPSTIQDRFMRWINRRKKLKFWLIINESWGANGVHLKPHYKKDRCTFHSISHQTEAFLNQSTFNKRPFNKVGRLACKLFSHTFQMKLSFLTLINTEMEARFDILSQKYQNISWNQRPRDRRRMIATT